MFKIMYEFNDLTTNPASNISVYLKDYNFRKWIAVITGPAECPYEDGRFYIKISFPDNYPNIPPNMKMTTYIYHPNVHDEGWICVDTIKENWRPSTTMRCVFNSIKGILRYPNPDNPWPARRFIAEEYKNDYYEFYMKARHYTQEYAN